jgi:hypothetical protein
MTPQRKTILRKQEECMAKLPCQFNKIAENITEELFCNFCRLGSYNLQNAFLHGLLKKYDCKRTHVCRFKRTKE